jgi:plasmid stability protein
MTRTTISLPNGLLTRLKILAAERGVSMTSLIRGVLEASTEDARPAPRSLGAGASGHSDTAQNDDDLLEPALWRWS